MKVLVTGLGLGYEFDMCYSCGVDYSWLIDNPSILLWTDKIIFPKTTFEKQLKTNENKIDKAINLVLNMANDSGLIEIVDIKSMYIKEVGVLLEKQSDNDAIDIMNAFPQNVSKGDERVPNEIIIDNVPYCGAYISSINASLFLGKELNANCLFSQRDYNFLKYKYGYNSIKGIEGNEQKIFNEIFSSRFPNELVLHNYAFVNEEKCLSCANCHTCKKTYLGDIENRMKRIIGWRDMDELGRAKEELQKIIDLKSILGNESSIEDVKREYQEKQRRINKNINKVFPQIKRWTNITTMLATPLTVGGAFAGNIGTTAIGGAAIGAAKIIDEAMKYYESKNNWVGFINHS